MDYLNAALLIFVRNPIPGKVKTRLAADIGAEKAMGVYTRLLQHTLLVTQNLPVSKFVFYGDGIPETDIWPDALYQKRPQEGVELGERMANALHEVLHSYQSVVLIGSDIADLDTPTLRQAFEALRFVDVVLGPAEDGGYYLIGCKASQPKLFQNIVWGSRHVFAQTLERLIHLHLDFKLLPYKSDIDTVTDLKRLGWKP